MRLSSGRRESLPDGRNRKIGVVVSRFNLDITERLLEGTLGTLRRYGVKDKDVKKVFAPGAFELPLLARRLASTKKFDAVIALGCVIRGETPHDRYISQAVADGILRASLDTRVPIIFGVLTTLNARQARARAGRGSANKGVEAAMAALDVIRALDGL